MAKVRGRSENENELKISLSFDDLEKVFRHFVRKVGRDKVAHKYMPRNYFDTEELDLFLNAISTRVQYKKGSAGHVGGHEQTVKVELPEEAPKDGEKKTKGLQARRECKNFLKDHRPDLDAVTDKIAVEKVKPFRGKTLTHIFTAAIERRYFNVVAGKGRKAGTVELAFDLGEIILQSDQTHHPYAEIEIEIKKGNREAIDEIAREILRIAKSAKIQPLSKAEQGTAMYIRSLKAKRP